jgi:hypothetical protein
MQAEYLVVDESRNERSELLKRVDKKSLHELLEMDDENSEIETDNLDFFDELIKTDYKPR